MEEVKDKNRIKIIDLLKSYPEGLTITDLMKKTKLARHTVLARLHLLVGEGKVDVRRINMAKVHIWKQAGPKGGEEKEEKEPKKEETKKIRLNPINKGHIKESLKPKPKPPEPHVKKRKMDIEKIKRDIFEELRTGRIKKSEAQIKEQRAEVKHIIEVSKHPERTQKKEYVKTGIDGLDSLIEVGIPKGTTILVAGGAGSGKTIMCLQILNYHASHGEKCLYMSFEESEKRLRQHMEDFGWNSKELEEKGFLKIQRFNPFDITRSVDALLMKAKGELLIDIEPVILPEGYKPDFIVVDSLTAIASAFTGKEDSYRIYIEQLFLFFEKIGATAFLVTETKQIPTVFSTTGVEEFLADGVIVLYSLKKGNIREYAAEILKLRGAKHYKRIVAMQITDRGVVVYPEQEVFTSIEESE